MKQKRSIGATLAGPTANIALEETSETRSYEEKISFLLEHLAESNNLTNIRPSEMPKNYTLNPPFVHESCQAISFIIPCCDELNKAGINAIKLWVSKPDHGDFVDEDWNWSGSYLFLTEIHFDDGEYHSLYSGCSALRFVANAVAGNKFLDMPGEEILGRFDKRPITTKLMQLGALPSEARKIEVLYRIRYMTDEQWHMDDGVERRVHDILGYPIFIAT